MLIRFGDDAENAGPVLVALDFRNVFDAFVDEIDHTVGNLIVERVIPRFVFGREIHDRVVDELGGRELLGRRADNREAFGFVVESEFDAGDGAANVILNFARNVAFHVEIIDGIFFVGRRRFDLTNVLLEAFDVAGLAGEEKSRMFLVVRGDDARFDARQRGDDFGRQFFFEIDDIDDKFELSFEPIREFNRRVDGRF